MKDYFGRYQEFRVPNKKDAAPLLGADSLVGDEYNIECELDGSTHTAWLVNKFDQRIGCFDNSFSRELSLLAAQGLELHAILSFVAFTDHPDEGHYWGEVAIICFNPAYKDIFENFIKNIGLKMAEGTRVVVDLDADAIKKVIDSNGSWIPKQTVALPKKQQGMAIIKRRLSFTDRLVKQGRAGNKGCFVASWIFLLLLVALLIFGLHSCGIF